MFQDIFSFPDSVCMFLIINVFTQSMWACLVLTGANRLINLFEKNGHLWFFICYVMKDISFYAHKLKKKTQVPVFCNEYYYAG